MEPLFRAVYHLHPEFNMNDINIAIDRNSMGKLFDFVTNSSRAFEIDVEIIGNTAVFVRREKSVTEFITEFRGFGYTFPEEYTTWDKEVKGSSSHHRIASFCFAGMKYLLRYESDGYLAEKAGVVKKSTAPGKGADADVDSAITSLGSDGSLNIGEKQPLAQNRLAIRSQGSEIDQRAVIDIKTRAAHKTLDTEIVLPRLWMSQTANLIAAYHKGGRFDNVQVLDVRDGIEQWQKNHAVELRKLNALILRIITTVKGAGSMKCRIKRADGGKLEIKELGGRHASALPEDLQLKLQGNGDSEKYYDWDDDQGLLDSGRKSEESDKDYTACSSEVCGYCGHCRY